uniref:Carboxylic ester hydrolase n=1 Tax=Romanomermis culicivorax TaxID=13658 RepID=A0A915LDF0_ROMCU
MEISQFVYSQGFWGSEMWNANTPTSEDCLYMNIWAPKDARNATVMVWLYGGGFYYGSSSLAIYDALGLAAVGEVIVVNVNYRMGAFGFLFLDNEEVPGNMGMLDQQMALKWIKRNAAAFGGDPAKVCLFGESAGAASIVAHMVAPSSGNLFKNGILQSGSLDNPWSMNTPRRALNKSMQLVEKVGCATNDHGNIHQIAKCLRNLDAKTLRNELWSITTGFLEFPLVMVSKDKAGFFVDDAFEALRKGNFRHTDIMIGINADEGVFWLVYYLKKYFSIKSPSLIDETKFSDCVEQAFGHLTGNQKRAVKFEYWDKRCSKDTTFYREAVNQMVGDYFFTCDSIWLGDEIVKRSKGSVYIYHFEQRSSNNPWPLWMGVMHGYEIEYVFGLPIVAPANFTGAFEHNFSRDVIGYWKSFAETR